MAHNIDREVLEGFVEEARSYLPAILSGIDSFRKQPDHPETLEEAHRLTHSIKGAASMVGLAPLGHIAFYLEEALEDAAAGKLDMNRETVGVLTETAAQIESYLDGVASGQLRERPLVTEVVRRFRRLRDLPEDGDEGEIERLLAGARPAVPGPAPAAVPERPATGEAVVEETSPELVEAFLDEAGEHLQAIGERLRKLEKEPGEPRLVQEVRRSIHTLKGAAAMVGFGEMSRLAHRAEDLLDRLHDGSAAADEDNLTLLFQTADAFADLLSGAPEDGGSGSGAELGELYGRYREVLGDEAAPAAPLAPLPEERAIDLAALRAAEPAAGAAREEARRAGARPGQYVRVPLDRLDELVRMVSELVVNRSTFEQHFGELGREVDELGLSVDRLRRLSGRLETEYEVATLGGGAGRRGPVLLTAAGAPVATAAVPEFDELEMDRYTEFHLLSRELTETGSDIGAVNAELGATIGDFDSYLSRLGRLTSEIQDKLMHLRMVPVATLASRLHRAVRVTASRQGKLVELVIEGEEVELDKTVLEEIADPLLHLMRNAVDHGIEPSALRQVVGKPERGRVRLRAYHEGTQVVLRISDDGAGVEPQLVRSAAVEGGYITESEAAELEDRDLFPALFLPGFSTAGEVSEVSGRGVGLDVVKATVEKMEGTVGVESTLGQGTTFTIRLPMTLAITRVLMVEAGGHVFAVPLGVVGQIVRMEREEVERLGREPVLRVEDRVYPLASLSDSLGLPAPLDPTLNRVPVLVVNLGEASYALAVDRLVEAREVVVKPLGTHLRRVHGITGATLMGDGSVVLILNPAELVTEAPRSEAAQELEARVARRVAVRPLDVLVVDDSLSVRRVLSNLVKNAGWNPITAKDGVEALEIIQRSPRAPDVILLDIEMPRMDGYELAATLKAQQAYRGVPIVIITSRAGDKHRQKAMDLGVDDYLVKPYQDTTLLNIIRRVTRRRPEAT